MGTSCADFRVYGFDFRAGTSMLVPYYRIRLSTDTQAFQIEKIVIGPTPNSRQSRRSLQTRLVKHDLETTKVRKLLAWPLRIHLFTWA